MAEILIKAVSAVHADPVKDRAGCHKKGDPIIIRPDGWSWGSKETLPDFVIIKVPGLDPATIASYMDSWRMAVSFAIITQTLPTDAFRIEITATSFNSSSGEGKITRSQVETFINSWGGSVAVVGDNSVRFDIAILNSLKSASF